MFIFEMLLLLASIVQIIAFAVTYATSDLESEYVGIVATYFSMYSIFVILYIFIK